MLSCKVPVILTRFNESWLLSTELTHNKYPITWNPSIRTELYHADRGTDGQTDIKKLIVALSILRTRQIKLQSSHRVHLGVIYGSVKNNNLFLYTLSHGSSNRMSIDELLPTFRKFLMPRTVFYSCLLLKISAVRSLECLFPFTSQRHHTWSFTQKNEKILQTCQRKIETRALLFGRQSNECWNN
jgi:hypothetical protein